MQPEQIPGSLFVGLVALVAYATGQWGSLLLLALGCAFGWASFAPEPTFANGARWAALGAWLLAFILVSIRILF